MPSFTRDGRKALLSFREITRSTDTRTMIFSTVLFIPCNHKIPIVLIHPQNHLFLAYLVACFSSFALDYIARQKVGGASVSLFVLKQLPIHPPAIYGTQCPWSPAQTIGEWIAPRALELTYTVWDLEAFAKDCGYAGPPFRWDEERRFLLLCELDAAYFLLYEIARADVDYIMDTFRVWKEKEEKQLGEYRTKRVILEMYDEMAQAMASGEAYRTRLVPGPADPAVVHEPRQFERLVAD